MHDELLGLGVVGGGGFHLYGVVAVAELGQSEAANILQVVDTVYITAQYATLQSVQYIIVQYSTVPAGCRYPPAAACGGAPCPA